MNIAPIASWPRKAWSSTATDAGNTKRSTTWRWFDGGILVWSPRVAMIGVEFDAQAVQDALLGQADALRCALEARIQQKLSGEVLQTRSGALAASIISAIEN